MLYLVGSIISQSHRYKCHGGAPVNSENPYLLKSEVLSYFNIWNFFGAFSKTFENAVSASNSLKKSVMLNAFLIAVGWVDGEFPVRLAKTVIR